MPDSVVAEFLGTWVSVLPPHRHNRIVVAVRRIKNARAFIKVLQS